MKYKAPFVLDVGKASELVQGLPVSNDIDSGGSNRTKPDLAIQLDEQ